MGAKSCKCCRCCKCCRGDTNDIEETRHIVMRNMDGTTLEDMGMDSKLEKKSDTCPLENSLGSPLGNPLGYHIGDLGDLGGEDDTRYQVAFKAPHGTTYQCLQGKRIYHDKDINVWLASLFPKDYYPSYLLYNDEEPNSSSHVSRSTARFAHAKGVLAWNDKSVAWLIHST